MSRRYSYIGPGSLAHLASADTLRVCVNTQGDIHRWVREAEQAIDDGGCVFATFVVDADGRLWIADRQSEHVACARGGDVLSAGEILFRASDEVGVEYVTNQSTGYCPEPESWRAVDEALRRAGIEPPDYFSKAFQFRRCTSCRNINIIKDDLFECDVCGAEIPRVWNLQTHDR